MEVTGSPETAEFEALRGRLFGVAYRMLGSRADAEDVVQEAYVRWHEADRAAIRNPEAWLVTAATRLAIDRLRRLKAEREAYVGPWLPEPLVVDVPPPDRAVESASDLSLAFLTLLERLAPEERAAFLLHEVFDVDYAGISNALGRSEAACRQVVHRARQRVRGERKRFDATEAARIGLLKKFSAAVEARNEGALLDLFAHDATWTADGGGKTAASLRPVVGAERIVRLILGLRDKFWHEKRTLQVVTVNGEAGLCVRDDGRVTAVMSFETHGDRIAAVYAIVNPDKLASVLH